MAWQSMRLENTIMDQYFEALVMMRYMRFNPYILWLVQNAKLHHYVGTAEYMTF
jgi:hypothetical protein